MRRVLASIAGMALAITPMAGVAQAQTPQAALAAAGPVSSWSTKTVTIVAGDTWSRTVRVKGGKREVKLQLKQGGPFRTVKTYSSKANGRLTVSRKFPAPGTWQARLIVVGKGAAKDRKTKPVPITVAARQYTGTFSGNRTNGTSWNATVTFNYQERDPVTNQPYTDGYTYVPVGGSLTWQYDVSGLNGSTRRNCTTANGSGTVEMTSLDAFVKVTVPREAKGFRYVVGASFPTGGGPSVDVTCEYEEEDEFLNIVWVPRTAPVRPFVGQEILLTNTLSEEATGVAGQFVPSLGSPLVGDVNRVPEASQVRWTWNLTAGR